LQSRDHGKPYVLIPATVLGRGQHHTIVYNPQRGALSAHDLTGKRVGVRAYTQTTGAWVRGFLSDDYGVDVTKVHWITFEDPHVAEFKDPNFVVRAPEGKAWYKCFSMASTMRRLLAINYPTPACAFTVPIQPHTHGQSMAEFDQPYDGNSKYNFEIQTGPRKRDLSCAA
jgi:4,5-dihydroxyphthalate decarboxylase